MKVSRIEITGLEIIGPNDDITYGEAMENRLIKSNKFVGRGIVAWSGNNIRIHHNHTDHKCYIHTFHQFLVTYVVHVGHYVAMAV